MRLTIDAETKRLTIEEHGRSTELDLYSTEAFELLSRWWLKVGWNQKYPYTFSWLGRPIIQLPEDLIRVQEVVYRVKPDIIIETGVAHGGSLVFHASLCRAMSRGRVIGVDVEVHPQNLAAIKQHALSPLITLVVGDSTSSAVVAEVKCHIGKGDRVMVCLDSGHSKEHVLSELEIYGQFVSPDSYVVATDGIMRDLTDVPRGNPEWVWDNPASAAEEFARFHPEFVLEQPQWPFNESGLRQNVTHWPSAWLRRLPPIPAGLEPHGTL